MGCCSCSRCRAVLAWERIAPCLVCPRCESALTREGAALRCRRGHTFNIARTGYADLLPARRGAATGDTRAMLLARRRFLERGHYRPLAAALVGAVARHLTPPPPTVPGGVRCIADAGCGEGYYLATVRDALPIHAASGPLAFVGSDVSREAAALAARRSPAINIIAADSWGRLPYRAASLTALLNLFAPRGSAEFARVVAPGGLLAIVIPTADHLRELRAALPLLGIQAGKRAAILAQFAGTFALTETVPLTFDLDLSGEDAADLLRMTPNAHHLTEDQVAAHIVALPRRVGARCELLLLRRGAR